MSTALLLYPRLDEINLDTFDLGNGFRRSKKQDLHSVSSLALGSSAPLSKGQSQLTSSLGLMLYRILSAFSLSCLLSMMARSSFEALF